LSLESAKHTTTQAQAIQQPALAVEIFLLHAQVGFVQQLAVKIPVAAW
jgi:hypothetical protein